MRGFQLAFIFFIVPVLVFGQNPIDSLYSQLEKTDNIEKRMRIYSAIIYKSSFTELNKALEISTEALSELETSEDSVHVPDLYNSIGIAYNLNGNYLVSIEYFLKALEGYSTLKDSSRIANALNNIGITYTEIRNFSKSKSFFRRSLKIHKKLKNFNEIAAVLNNLGDLNEIEGNIDSAEYYYKTSLEIAEFHNLTPRISDGNLNLGSISLKRNSFQKALRHLYIALKIDESNDNLTGLVETYGLLGETYLAMKNYEMAYHFLQKGLNLSQELQMKTRESEIYRVLSKYYAETGSHQQALEVYMKYSQLKDSVLSLETKRQIEDLQLNYENEKKAQEISLLSERANLQETQLKLQKTKTRFLLIFTLFTIFVLGLLLVNIRIKNKANNLLKSQNEKIQQQNEELETRSRKLLELSEEKDNFINVVAHDLKSPLNNISGLANLLRINGKLNEEQQHFLNLLEQVSNEAKNLISNLLDINKLESGNIQENFETFDIKDLIAYEIRFFDKDALEKNITLIELCKESIIIKNNKSFIQRILNNLISNAIKFSQPNKNVWINCRHDGQQLELSVKDQGPGISKKEQVNLFKKFQKLSTRPTGGESSTGLGLAIVKLMVDKLQGNIEVISEPKQGTEFRIKFPASITDKS